ncbi:TPA: hypothetical protein DE059_01040 [Candidatus Peribacteria bacterium]|nr:hypothetical protein [Candidatus Peribacteria bacterium]
MPHIAIVGAGQIGSCHLLGLSRINQDIEITLIDPNPSALQSARDLYHDMPENPLIKSVNYLASVDQLDDPVDVTIIATTADVRRNVIENLLSNTLVRYLILEKVVFQSANDFEAVIQLLKDKKIMSWVNCTRRMYPLFRSLKTELESESRIQLNVEGGNFGLASNAIHMLDLFAFLTGETHLAIDASGLDAKVYQSKRNGFIEFGGVLLAENSRGDQLTLIDEKESTDQVILTINSRCHRYKIYQFDGKVLSAHRENRWEEKEEFFEIPLQSELTYLVIQQILDTGSSNLTHLEESFVLHTPMLDAFNEHLATITSKVITSCPIT